MSIGELDLGIVEGPFDKSKFNFNHKNFYLMCRKEVTDIKDSYFFNLRYIFTI